jgi:hypothetical protein
MKPPTTHRLLPGILCGTLFATGVLNAQPEPSVAPAAVLGSSNTAEDAALMKQMVELSKTNENHKLLASMVGTWSYVNKMTLNPGAPPMESTGTAVRKPVMDGRYFSVDYTGKMKMPGADGKLRDFEFKGTSLEGYDNAKKKFVATWSDNMETGIMLSEGTYDPATKTFTYTSEYEMVPGMKVAVREVIRLVDADHHIFEWYETHGAEERKTMEISYTRKK